MPQQQLKLKFGFRSDFAASKVTRTLGFLEQIYVVSSLMLSTGIIANLLNQGMASGATSQIETATAVVATLIMIPRLIIQRREMLLILWRSKALLLFVGLICSSILWSEATGITGRNLVIPLRLTVFALYLALRFSMGTQLRLFAWSLGIGAVVSLVLGIFVPSYGLMGVDAVDATEGSQEEIHAGAWKGAYGHKNPFARAMSIGTIVFLLLAAGSHLKFLLLTFSGLCTILVILSTSKTGLIVILTLLCLIPAYQWLQRSSGKLPLFVISIIFLVGSFSMLFISSSEVVLGALGRDATLSGRTELWTSTWQQVMAHPWLGYGYNVFWKTSLVRSVWDDVGWQPPHSHNGFLDICIDVGIIGLLIFMSSLASFFIRAVQWARDHWSLEGIWPLMFMSVFLLYNITESSILKQGYIFLMYSSITYSMHSIRSESKL